MSSPLLLHAESIAKSFSGVPALVDGSLALRAGTVHALCGGNGAGKSTLLNVLMGILKRDAGTIRMEGREVQFDDPHDALNAGVAIISQELEPVPDMSVAENIYLGREPRRRFGLIDHRAMREQAAELLESLGLNLAPDAKLGSLSIADMQMVEIARAISRDARVIIMDEPTSAIGERETELLFTAIERLKARGTGIIYVSHRMNELYRIADDYTIMRDGAYIESGAMADIDRRRLITTVLGKELDEEFAKFNAPGDNTLLEVDGYSRGSAFRDVSLHLKSGEILGIFGLMGSGRSEFLDALFGASPADQGEARLDGNNYRPCRPADAMRAGFAYVTEDRKGSGLVMDASIKRNVTLASIPEVARSGLISEPSENRATLPFVDKLQIKASSVDMPVKQMSGGNQQKVVLAKWLQTDPRILMLDEPTRGVDVGAKREIYAFMSEFARDDRAIIMTSSEIPEVLGMSDRVIVFRKGRVSGELSGDELTQENLVRLSS
ncbi:enolase [Litchfieldella qijiaojingensis]|uniref:Enolase n=1 Tax=Litchfieldella qijiaojingensis TaxID=980347 RepID=A0ABQ2Z0K8_9GAMM|nr:sugar ABC transporter ATP-binding protein [Halomonas qijiaojingensis]GGX98212.1 enolase [Halomonas qijiaojingensis]